MILDTIWSHLYIDPSTDTRDTRERYRDITRLIHSHIDKYLDEYRYLAFDRMYILVDLAIDTDRSRETPRCLEIDAAYQSPGYVGERASDESAAGLQEPLAERERTIDYVPEDPTPHGYSIIDG